MREFLGSPAVRFLTGFVIVAFFFFPLMWVGLGPERLGLSLGLAAVAGIIGGASWVLRPPAFLYAPIPPVEGAGVFNSPAVRFFAGFAFGSVVFILVMWLIEGAVTTRLLIPMMGAALAGGLLSIRLATTKSSSRGRTP